jgi:hypothetical protein
MEGVLFFLNSHEKSLFWGDFTVKKKKKKKTNAAIDGVV